MVAMEQFFSRRQALPGARKTRSKLECT